MAPNTSIPTGVLNEYDYEIQSRTIPPEIVKPSEIKYHLLWKNITFVIYHHLVAVYGLFLIFTSAKIWTTLMVPLFYILTMWGTTAGAHRLWSHRGYRANWPLRLMLIILQTLGFQHSVIEWAKYHRIHHKYCDTDADPHNSRRGFFFSHVGWLLCLKHREFRSKYRTIDVSDLQSDPILAFQHKYYGILSALICFVLPTWIPIYFWNETFITAYSLNILRYIATLNATSLINSAAHMFGQKPYDKFICPTDKKITAIIALGEGWHNYHHTFPWDYKASELGEYCSNFTCAFIDFFAKIGWAYDLRTVSPEMLKKRVLRTGDGSHEIWGWGDRDQNKEDYEDATIIYRKKQ